MLGTSLLPQFFPKQRELVGVLHNVIRLLANVSSERGGPGPLPVAAAVVVSRCLPLSPFMFQKGGLEIPVAGCRRPEPVAGCRGSGPRAAGRGSGPRVGAAGRGRGSGPRAVGRGPRAAGRAPRAAGRGPWAAGRTKKEKDNKSSSHPALQSSNETVNRLKIDVYNVSEFISSAVLIRRTRSFDLDRSQGLIRDFVRPLNFSIFNVCYKQKMKIF